MNVGPLETLTKKSCKSFNILHPYPFAFNSGYVFQYRPIKTKHFRIIDSLRPQSHDDIQLLQRHYCSESKRDLDPLYLIPFPPIQSNISNLDTISIFFLFALSFSHVAQHFRTSFYRKKTSLVFVFSLKLSIPQGIKLALRMKMLCISLSKISLDSLSYKGSPQVYSIPNMIRSDSNS